MISGNGHPVTRFIQSFDAFDTTPNGIPALYSGDIFLLTMVDHTIPFKDYLFGQLSSSLVGSDYSGLDTRKISHLPETLQ